MAQVIIRIKPHVTMCEIESLLKHGCWVEKYGDKVFIVTDNSNNIKLIDRVNNENT